MDSVKITNKAQMYELLSAGRFGNHIRVWYTLDEALASGYTGLVSIRSLQVTHPVRLYHNPMEKLAEIVAGLPSSVTERGLVFFEAPPDAKRTIQGELTRLDSGYYLYYSRDCSPMRIALEKDGKHAYGLAAKLILQHYLEPSDYDALQDLLDDFPGAVIEFSATSVPIGVIPHRKMVVWEVRHY